MRTSTLVSGLLPFLALGWAFHCGSNGDDSAAHPPGGSNPDASTKTDSSNPPGDSSTNADTSGPSTAIQTVFVVLMENHNWADMTASSAPYITGTLVPMGAHAENYMNPVKLHPSEPNYIWLEAGDTLGVTTDDDPAVNHQATTDHLVTQLKNKGISWKSYAENITGTECPLTSSGLYAAKHTPQIYFDDVTDTNKANSQYCIDHLRPYPELATDLSADKVARYNFISPNLCNMMHGVADPTILASNPSCLIDGPVVNPALVKLGDTWLKNELPKIFNSNAYKNGGVLFVLFDEGRNKSDGPVPFLVFGKNVKVNYASSVAYDHSAMLRTVEAIFGVPFLRNAKTAPDLSDMFTSFP